MKAWPGFRDRGATLRFGGGGGGTISDLILGGGGTQDTFSYYFYKILKILGVHVPPPASPSPPSYSAVPGVDPENTALRCN